MAKPRQRQSMAIPSNKNCNPSGPEVEQPGEDDWVIVKKQIVRILIPSLPVNKYAATPAPDSGPTQGRAKPRETINTQSDCPMGTPLHSVHERKKFVSLVSNKCFPTARRSRHSISTFARLPRMDPWIGRENPHQVRKTGFRKSLGVCVNSGVSKRPPNFVRLDALLNQRMRASILDRKLQRSGGLSHWLASLGLDQFVKIFQERTVNKFQLVKLTMKKLKDMGADAVGPRRKLMHAIDCLCQPYCFEVL